MMELSEWAAVLLVGSVLLLLQMLEMDMASMLA